MQGIRPASQNPGDCRVFPLWRSPRSGLQCLCTLEMLRRWLPYSSLHDKPPCRTFFCATATDYLAYEVSCLWEPCRRLHLPLTCNELPFFFVCFCLDVAHQLCNPLVNALSVSNKYILSKTLWVRKHVGEWSAGLTEAHAYTLWVLKYVSEWSTRSHSRDLCPAADGGVLED